MEGRAAGWSGGWAALNVGEGGFCPAGRYRGAAKRGRRLTTSESTDSFSRSLETSDSFPNRAGGWTGEDPGVGG